MRFVERVVREGMTHQPLKDDQSPTRAGPMVTRQCSVKAQVLGPANFTVMVVNVLI